ncbi:PaaI family thioesterase [Limisalsivibrio acetivorans]|uniref:PaaI family thioesterase n=1 Tax=Limisalsivibrio acetivorans TaxID=1304888 RepID=UPI0003B49AFC|nr:PaaI family thioesterase [Limisalsivibrio acetivorans]
MGIRYSLPHSTGCFICGEENRFGLNTRFFAEDETVYTDINIPLKYCGYKNVIHGGIVTALLDETMGWAAFIYGSKDYMLFTRNLEIKYRRNTPAETDLRVVTRFTERRKILYGAAGKIIDAEGTVYAEGKGEFAPIPEEKLEETFGYLLFNEDEEYHPVFMRLYNRWLEHTAG